jgi:sialic acid synthase SpsE
MAAAIGCVYFEKHFTLDREDTGPDHAASLDSKGFAEYILAIRESFLILGSENPSLSKAELDMSKTSRKSLHLRFDLKRGHRLAEDDFVLLRPGSGLLYSDLPTFLGRTLIRDVTANEIFDSSMI